MCDREGQSPPSQPSPPGHPLSCVDSAVSEGFDEMTFGGPGFRVAAIFFFGRLRVSTFAALFFLGTILLRRCEIMNPAPVAGIIPNIKFFLRYVKYPLHLSHHLFADIGVCMNL